MPGQFLSTSSSSSTAERKNTSPAKGAIKSQLFSLTNEATTIEQDISHLVDLSMFSMYNERLDDGYANNRLPQTCRSDPSTIGTEQVKRKLENDYKIALITASSQNQNLQNQASVPGMGAIASTRPSTAVLGPAARAADSVQPGTMTTQSRPNAPSIPVPLKSSTFMPQLMSGFPAHKPQPVAAHPGNSSSAIFPPGSSLPPVQSSNPFFIQPSSQATTQTAGHLAGQQQATPASAQSAIAPAPPGSSSSKPRRVRSLPVNEEGSLLLPIVLGRANSRVSIYSIGTITPSIPALHNESYIYPAGYISKRKFSSYLDPTKRVFYTCKILPSRPELIGSEPVMFQIIMQSQPKNRFESPKMETLWAEFKACFQPEQAFPDLCQFVNGEDFFGLEHDGVKKYIQEMPGARECIRYRFVDYITRGVAPNKKPNTMAPTAAAAAAGLGYPMNLQGYAGFPGASPGTKWYFSNPMHMEWEEIHCWTCLPLINRTRKKPKRK